MSAFVENLEERRLLSTTFYVSPTGSDSAAGSQAAPFATIQQAANEVTAGDTVIVEAGTYAGFVLSWNNAQAGTSTAPITFEADPSAAPGSVIIDSRDNKTAVGIDLEPGSDYVTIKGFTVINSDSSITKAGIKATGNYDSIIDNTVTGVGGFGLFTDNANYALVEGNTVSGTTGTDTNGHGIYISGTCTGVVVDDNLLYDNGWHGIHLNGDASEGGVGEVIDATVENNIIYGTPGNGINGDGVVDSLIENNLIYGYTNNGISLYTIDAGVGSTGNTIANNTIIGGSAIELQDGATGNVIFNNVITGKITADSSSSYVASNNITNATFVDSATGNYQLAAGSSAIGAGVASYDGQSAPTTDILGSARGSSNDAGAYQYGDTAVTNPGAGGGAVTGPTGTSGTGSSGSGSSGTGSSGSGSSGTGSSGSGSSGTGSSGSGSSGTGTGSGGTGATGTGSSGDGSSGTGSSGSGSSGGDTGIGGGSGGMAGGCGNKSGDGGGSGPVTDTKPVAATTPSSNTDTNGYGHSWRGKHGSKFSSLFSSRTIAA